MQLTPEAPAMTAARATDHNAIPPPKGAAGCGGGADLQPDDRTRLGAAGWRDAGDRRRGGFALWRLKAIACRPMDHIASFHNLQRKNVGSGRLLPIALEQPHRLKLQGDWETKGAPKASRPQSAGAAKGRAMSRAAG